ncbi:beta-1,4-N-acetylgalactosaminyltransferase 3 [Ictalurus furcatus]|uniref:beta-1,4-N-acetylgalactosaminyltransferase 3 n=1 Tax=Ictalurus furcatus TaxID=66913 RepID=UPI00234FB7CE|nr:beta-1,4-N-acetylgalactosaminyltransferase 3 [Ictalurus furcatus]
MMPFFPLRKLKRNGKYLLFGALLVVVGVAAYLEYVAMNTWDNVDDGQQKDQTACAKPFGSQNRDHLSNQDIVWSSKYVPQPWRKEYEGQANLHVFEDWCGTSVASLRKNPHYPLYPHSRITVKKLAVYPNWKNYGLRIFGYIHPFTSGEFLFAVASADNCEFWLSQDENPENLRLRAHVGKSGEEWTAPGEYSKYTSQISKPVLLQQQKRFYFELIHKHNNHGTDHVEVAWRLNKAGMQFELIDSNSLSLYTVESSLKMSDVSHIPQTVASHVALPLEKTEVPHHGAEMLREDPRDTFFKMPLLDKFRLWSVLPECSYNPSYTVKDSPIGRYQGLQFVHLSYVYPNDYTRLTHMERDNMCFYQMKPFYFEMYGFSHHMRLDRAEEKDLGFRDIGDYREGWKDFRMRGRAGQVKSEMQDKEEFDYQDDYMQHQQRKLFSNSLDMKSLSRRKRTDEQDMNRIAITQQEVLARDNDSERVNQHKRQKQNKMADKNQHKRQKQNKMSNKNQHKLQNQNKMADETQHNLQNQNKMADETQHKLQNQNKMADETQHNLQNQNKMADETQHNLQNQNKMADETQHKLQNQNKMADETQHNLQNQNKMADETQHNLQNQNKMADETQHNLQNQNKMADETQHNLQNQNKMADETQHNLQNQNKMADETQHNLQNQNKMADETQHNLQNQNKMADETQHNLQNQNKMADETQHNLQNQNKMADENHQYGWKDEVPGQKEGKEPFGQMNHMKPEDKAPVQDKSSEAKPHVTNRPRNYTGDIFLSTSLDENTHLHKDGSINQEGAQGITQRKGEDFGEMDGVKTDQDLADVGADLWGLTRDLEIEDEIMSKAAYDPEIRWNQTFQIGQTDFQTLRTDWIDLNCNVSGNLLISQSEVTAVVQAFMEKLRLKYPGQFSLQRVVNVVKRVDEARGNRYLLELDLMEASGARVRLVHYVYVLKMRNIQSVNTEKMLLCNPHNFLWNPDATIHIIIPVKNQARWVQKFIADMEELHQVTGDNNVNIIITDYSSTDMDIEQALKDSRLPKSQYLRLTGNFERSAGLQAGINLITDNHSIVFLCDLHLHFPPSFFESVRKHCVEGHMAFAPLVMRLNCGATPQEPDGYWEVNGFGLLGIYKSDLDAVGGMNTREFTNRWGGEDWELLDRIVEAGLEVERLHLRNFFHYHHSRRGMWNRKTLYRM